MSHRTLWEVADEVIQWSEMLQDACTVEEEEAIGKKLDEIELEFSQKIKSYLNLLKNLDANLGEVDKELERLKRAKYKIKRTEEFLKQNLMSVLKAQNLDKYKCGTNTLSICKVGGKRKLVKLCKPEELPEYFRKEQVVVDFDNDKIREYLDSVEDGVEENKFVGKFTYAPRGERLSIR